MKQVLIVDDEARLLKSIVAGLQNYKDNFEVLTALNGKAAISILKTVEVDLVITDLRMPEMDGLELLAYISHTHPFMPAVVMTAFATTEIEERVNESGIFKLLEKPIDFDRLAETIMESLEQEGKEGSIAGFSLANFLQLLAMEQKTCLLNITSGAIDGYVYLHQGEIHAAVCGTTNGEEALYLLLASEKAKITFRKLPKKKIRRMINKPLMSLLMEGMQYMDASKHLQQQGVSASIQEVQDIEQSGSSAQEEQSTGEAEVNMHNSTDQLNKGDTGMEKLEESLGKLKDIDGFLAAGIFTPNGEIASEVNVSNMNIAEIGSMANDVLLKAQKATDIMNVGRGNVVHIEAPKAHVFARCHNENTDFSETEAGKAHIHVVMLLAKDANLGMGKIKLELVTQEVASAFR